MEKIINSYSSKDYKLYEIKYVNIPSSEPKHKRYSWFFSKLNGEEKIKLDMVEYIPYLDYVIRIFKQGIFIEINKTYGFYNGHKFSLTI